MKLRITVHLFIIVLTALALGTPHVLAQAAPLSAELRPQSGPPGTEVRIVGQGAPAGAAVEVIVAPFDRIEGCREDRGGAEVLRTTVDAGGAFQITHRAVPTGAGTVGLTYVARLASQPERSAATLCFSFAPGQVGRYFPETGYQVEGVFLSYWEQHGGLPVFGYPLTPQQLEDGRIVQWFERARFELNPDQTRPEYRVLLGRLGAERFERDRLEPGAAAAPAAGECAYIAAINIVCDQEPGRGFLTAWRSHGLEFDGRVGKSFEESLALFGYPLSVAYVYTDANGVRRTVQWFERARFEWHPANPDPYVVLFGRLGAEELGAR